MFKVDRAKEILRLREAGISINEVARQLNCHRGTVLYWTRRGQVDSDPEKVRETARKNIVHAIKKVKDGWDQWKIEAENEAEHEWESLKGDGDFMLGLGLYWGEGTKANKVVSLGNLDLNLLSTFQMWAEKYLLINCWSCCFWTSSPSKMQTIEKQMRDKFGDVTFTKAQIVRKTEGHQSDFGVVALTGRRSTRALYKTLKWIELAKRV